MALCLCVVARARQPDRDFKLSRQVVCAPPNASASARASAPQYQRLGSKSGVADVLFGANILFDHTSKNARQDVISPPFAFAAFYLRRSLRSVSAVSCVLSPPFRSGLSLPFAAN